MARSSSYPLESVERGLVAVVFASGNTSEANRRTGIPRQTLDRWKALHADRYQELRVKYRHEIEERVVQDARDLLVEISRAEHLAVRRSRERLEKDEDSQPATTLQRLSTSKGINTDKLLLLEGRPTQISSTESPEEILKQLREHLKRAGAIDVHVEAEEVDEAA